MPDATVSLDTVHEELKSLPGAYVELRALPFGRTLDRRDMASRMSMDAGNRKKKGDEKLNIDMMQRAAKEYEFAHCIVDHNLEDKNGIKLNFANGATLDALSPRVGQEIESLIDKLNGEDDEEDLRDFLSAQTSSSLQKENEQNTSTKL